MFEKPTKCAIQKTDHGIQTILLHEDNSQLSDNELDIGQKQWPYSWPAEIEKFTWRFMNYSPDIPNRYWQMRCFAAMLQSIASIIPKKFDFVPAESKSHFRIEFTDDIEAFGNPAVLAQAYLVFPKGSYNGLMQWNDNWYFTPYGDRMPAHLVQPTKYTEGQKDSNGNLIMLPTESMLHIGMHEFGHTFGFNHDKLDPDSIMYPYAKTGYLNGKINEKAFKWTDKDVAWWHKKYGARSLTKARLIFAERRLRGRFVAGIPYRVTV